MSTVVELKLKIDAGFVRATELIKQVNNSAKARTGELTTLNTADKSSVVNALNELKSMIDNYSQIDDNVTNTTSTWSANKISTEITSAINGLINGADVNSDSLKELADKITALAQADNGLLSFANPQTLSEAQQQQGQTNLNVYSKDDIGDIESADFVAVVNNTFNT